MNQQLRKKQWQAMGGCANPDLYRRMRGGAWTYWRLA